MSQSTRHAEEVLVREFHEKVNLGPASADVMNSPFVKLLDRLKKTRPELFDCKTRELTGNPFKDGLL
jgi:hypothetical protein